MDYDKSCHKGGELATEEDTLARIRPNASSRLGTPIESRDFARDRKNEDEGGGVRSRQPGLNAPRELEKNLRKTGARPSYTTENQQGVGKV